MYELFIAPLTETYFQKALIGGSIVAMGLYGIPASMYVAKTAQYLDKLGMKAFSMEETQTSVRVPMLRTREPAKPTISSTSFSACAITGEAPAASRTLAV